MMLITIAVLVVLLGVGIAVYRLLNPVETDANDD